MAFLRTAMARTNLDIKVSCAFAYKRCIHGITQPPPLDSRSVTSPALSLPEIDRSLDPIHIEFGYGFNIGTGSMELMAVPKKKTKNYGTLRELSASCKFTGIPSVLSAYRESKPGFFLGAQILSSLSNRSISTLHDSPKPDTQEASATATDVPPRIKFKRLDKTARHIMQILDKEAVEEVHTQREIPDIKPGYIIQLRLEVPENKRRVSTVKGIVIARRNAGLNTTIRLRRMVAGVGVESLLPLYSPNVKEIKVLDKKKVRRAKLYYLREKMNALKK